MLSNAQVQRTLEQKADNGVIATPSHVNEVPTLWTLHLKQGESSLYIGLLRNAGQDDYRKPFVGDSPYALMKQPSSRDPTSETPVVSQRDITRVRRALEDLTDNHVYYENGSKVGYNTFQ